ncbi:MAG: polysaccharide deacetylase family protein [Anaerolineae bacterium]|nr:polysaccharide deacetylase family protein [Anaerolineae bacterium]
MEWVDVLIDRAIGLQPSRPLLALTTILLPRRYMARLYARQGKNGLDWGRYRGGATLSFDVDMAEDVAALPWLLDTLAPYPFRASFACIGRWVEEAPEVHRRIVGEGHEVTNHTYSHPWSEAFDPRPFHALSLEEQAGEVRRGHETIVRLMGVEPVGFRAPHLDRPPGLYRILADLGYVYSSSIHARRVGVQPFHTAEGVWEFPISQCPRHPSSVFDTHHAFRSRSWLFRVRPEDEVRFFDSFRYLLALAERLGAFVNVYFDPLDVRAFRDFRRFLDALEAARDVLRVAPYGEMAAELSQRMGVRSDLGR